MRILFNIAHPGQIHLFKNAIRSLHSKGHECKITVVDKEVSRGLLDVYCLDYELVGNARCSLSSKAIEMVRVDWRLYRIAKSFKPDVLIGGVGNAYVAHVGMLVGRPSIVFDDTEHAIIEHLLMDPFVSVVCTPRCYQKDLGKKQIRYDGYHELAYLHPNYFTPDLSVLGQVGLTPDDVFFVVRFVSWMASHDVRQHGIRDRVGLVKELEKYGKVIITSEGRLPSSLEQYRMRVSPEKLHDLLYYATLYIGEGATTASECAVLGTHAIYVNTLRLGYLQEEEEKYGLIYCFSDRDTMGSDAFEKVLELLQDQSLRLAGKKKRERLLRDKIDVTAFMVWFIENYPDSMHEVRRNPSIQEQFRTVG